MSLWLQYFIWFSILFIIDISVTSTWPFLIIDLTLRVRKSIWDFTLCQKMSLQLYFQERLCMIITLRKSKTKIWFNIWPVQTPTWTIGPQRYFRSLRISVKSEPLFNNPPHVYFPPFPLVNIWRFTVLLVALQENLTFPWIKWLLIYELEKSSLWQFKSKFWPPDPEFYFYFI